jgi:hypothetical protein
LCLRLVKALAGLIRPILSCSGFEILAGKAAEDAALPQLRSPSEARC